MSYACFGLAIIFLILAALFTILRDKGAMLISGFNTLSPSQKDLYDSEKIVKDMRNSLLLWTLIFLIGGLLSHFISQYFAILAFIIWLIVFFKDVHLDATKAFEKYKK